MVCIPTQSPLKSHWKSAWLPIRALWQCSQPRQHHVLCHLRTRLLMAFAKLLSCVFRGQVLCGPALSGCQRAMKRRSADQRLTSPWKACWWSSTSIDDHIRIQQHPVPLSAVPSVQRA